MWFSGGRLYSKLQNLGGEKRRGFPVKGCTQNRRILAGKKRCGFPVKACTQNAESLRRTVVWFSGEGLYSKSQYLGGEKRCGFPVKGCTQNRSILAGKSDVFFR